MKLKHWVGLAFAIIGILFVFHIAMSHGGIGALKSGIGLKG